MVHTLYGDDLAWLEFQLSGLHPAGYRLSGDGPRLLVPTGTVRAGDALDLLDPEGVTVGRVVVSDLMSTPDGDLVAGTPEPVSPFAHPDHQDLRLSPTAVTDGDAPVAVWGATPSTFAFREAAARFATRHGNRVLEVVDVAAGRDADAHAHLGAMLTRRHTTRGPQDRVVVVTAPDVGWGETGLWVRCLAVSAYGASTVVVPVPVDPVTADRLAAATGVRPVFPEVPPEHAMVRLDELDDLLVDGSLPAWVAEPQVAELLLAVHRPRATGGFTVLLSGLSGSGKSTVARSLAVRLMEAGTRSVSLLDGDVVRHHLSKGLGFSREDRDTNVRRIGFVASEITKAGGIAVCAPIAPYDATRKDVRAMVEQHGGFVLVHVATPLAECERRDRKGLYAKARRGEIPEFTGISDPYEPPDDAELALDTTDRDLEACVAEVITVLRRLGYLPAAGPAG